MNNETRIEFKDGIPYEVRVHRNVDKRRAEKARKGPSVQDEMNAVAISSISGLRDTPTQFKTVLFDGERMSNYEIAGTHIPLTDCAPEEITDPDSITATSTPDYGACAWNEKHWELWYNAMVAANGADAAAAAWGDAFDKTGMTQWAWFKNIQAFRDFCQQNNLIAKSTVLQAQAKAIGIKQGAADVADKTLKMAGDVVKAGDDTVDHTAKAIKWAPYVIAGILLLAVGVWTFISISTKKIAIP